MAEMTLLEAARHLDEGKGAEAVGLLAKAARTVMQHAGDMKKLDQERRDKEGLLAVVISKIESAKLSEIEETNLRSARLTAALEEDNQTLNKSKEETKPALEELAEVKEQIRVAQDKLLETISESDRTVKKGERDLKETQNKLTEVKEAIKQAKAYIGAL